LFTFLLSKARWARQKFKMETNLKKIMQVTKIQQKRSYENEMSQTQISN